MASRRCVEKPANVNVTVYVPGGSSTILYSPVPSVTAVRTFSINAGLLASTVTPGSNAPVASFTVPAMAPRLAWAPSNTGVPHRDSAAIDVNVMTNGLRMVPPIANGVSQDGSDGNP